LISGFTLILLSTILYKGIERTQEAAFDTSLNNYAVDIANATDFNLISGLVVKRDALIDENKLFPFPLGLSFVQIRTLNGAVVLSSKSLGAMRLPISRSSIERLNESGAVFQTIDMPNGPYRMVDFLISRPEIPPLILQVAVPLTMLVTERSQIVRLLWTLIPLALLAAAFGGLFVARRALIPMQNIIGSARAIEPHELSKRIDVPAETETRDLALTLNDLLSRLQTAFQSQEQFIADASHQLKTPLAIMRGEIDVYRAKIEGSEGATLLGSLSQEINQLAKMVDDLLLLARFDSGSFAPQFSRVRIDEVLIEAIRQLNRLAREQQVEIEFTLEGGSDEAADLETKGDFDLLRGLFFNLIENSIKYSPKPGKTTVQIKDEGTDVRVDISDRGVGISTEDMGRIFDRFYRGGQSQHKIPGVGLGLSIASRIARFHAADLTVNSSVGVGTTFTFRIKKF
jgi:signal transduction histidine kinase